MPKNFVPQSTFFLREQLEPNRIITSAQLSILACIDRPDDPAGVRRCADAVRLPAARGASRAAAGGRGVRIRVPGLSQQRVVPGRVPSRVSMVRLTGHISETGQNHCNRLNDRS